MSLTAEELKHRVIAHTSRRDGTLQNMKYDLDARTTAILNKRKQLSRDFGFISILSFSTTILASWESFATTFQGGLVNGGPSALLYGFILSFLGTLATAASLAEMASISPTSGGQYYWVALLAPRNYAIVFSWFAGWLTVFQRIAVTASISFFAGTMIQGLIILNYPSYKPQQYHGTLLYYAIVALILFVNVFGMRIFPHIETIALILHIIFFFMLMVPMVYLAPRSSPKFVFASFENNGGWTSNGVSWCIGLLTSTYALSGIDGASHMSEEVEDAAMTVARGMIYGVILSGCLCFGFSVAVLFGIGDITSALQSPTTFPIIQIFYTATQSYKATNAMTAAVIISLICSSLGLLASASRLSWAFARDEGLPFPKYFSHVDSHHRIPIRAILCIGIILMLLGLINLGSTTAFNAFVSLTLLGQWTTYLVPTICILLHRINGEKNIPFGPWRLGKLGVPVNTLTIAFSGLTIAFNVLPPYYPVNTANFNYAPVVFGAALLICGVMWFARGKSHYAGPIREVLLNGDVRSALLDKESNWTYQSGYPV